jgi:hypothetical protein
MSNPNQRTFSGKKKLIFASSRRRVNHSTNFNKAENIPASGAVKKQRSKFERKIKTAVNCPETNYFQNQFKRGDK